MQHDDKFLQRAPAFLLLFFNRDTKVVISPGMILAIEKWKSLKRNIRKIKVGFKNKKKWENIHKMNKIN